MKESFQKEIQELKGLTGTGKGQVSKFLEEENEPIEDTKEEIKNEEEKNTDGRFWIIEDCLEQLGGVDDSQKVDVNDYLRTPVRYENLGTYKKPTITAGELRKILKDANKQISESTINIDINKDYLAVLFWNNATHKIDKLEFETINNNEQSEREIIEKEEEERLFKIEEDLRRLGVRVGIFYRYLEESSHQYLAYTPEQVVEYGKIIEEYLKNDEKGKKYLEEVKKAKEKDEQK